MTDVQIDWSNFDKFPESTCTCKCDTVFRSHAKMVMSPSVMVVSRKPCPSCGKQEVRRASSDPESYSIKG